MFFRRTQPRQPSFEERIEGLKEWGFEVLPQPDGSVVVRRDGCQARVRRGDSDSPLVEQAGRQSGDETARLVDAGYQKFWMVPGGRRWPAVASELKALHAFEEDLREALGLTSLYNTSLGTVNAIHWYDRLQEREDGMPL
ncbi:MAG: hypothetical protein ACP5U2_18305 [Bryobacteraceae bacterium]